MVLLAGVACGGGEKMLRQAAEEDLGHMVLLEGDVTGAFIYSDVGIARKDDKTYRVDFQADPPGSDPKDGPLCVQNDVALLTNEEEATTLFEKFREGIEAGSSGGDPTPEVLSPSDLVDGGFAFHAVSEPFLCISKVKEAHWYSVAVQRSNVVTLVHWWSAHAEGVDQAVSLANLSTDRIETVLGQP
jgi:hypothetical protein